MTKIMACLLLAGLLGCSGCAGPGQLTPAGVRLVNGAIATAVGLLRSLDGFYGDLVELKMVPDHRVQATRALSIADVAAAALKEIVNGKPADDAALNVAAGQVDGARAILAGLR